MTGPLAGKRILDLSGLAGAYGTMLLAALGAEVVLVEPPTGNGLRKLPPFVPGAGGPESSLWFMWLGQGKRSVVLDLATDDGTSGLRKLYSTADAVVETAAPGTFEALGLGYEEAHRKSPGLSWVSVTPFGQTGPRRNWKGSNLIAWAASGILYQTGFMDKPPATPGGPVQLACHVAALNAASAVLLALRGRRASGRGQYVDISLQEAALAIAPEAGVPLSLDDGVHRQRSGNRRQAQRPFGLYPAADGWVSLLAVQPGHWTATANWIAEVTGNDSLLDESFQNPAVRFQAGEYVDACMEEVTRPSSKLDLCVEGQRRGIPVTPVNTIADLRSDPHLAASGYFEETEHPVAGRFTRPGPPFRDNHGWWSLSRAPLLGEHTAELLS